MLIELFEYFGVLFLKNIGWTIINIALPVLLPVCGLLIMRWVALSEQASRQTKVISTIQDGQLGWVTVVWSAATLYEAWGLMTATRQVLDWVAAVLFIEVALMIVGTFIAAAGAVTAGTTENKFPRLQGSIVLSSISAVMFIGTHLKTLY